MVDNKLNMSEQCAAVAKQANRILGCMNQCITNRGEEVISLHSELAGHSWNAVQFWSLLCKGLGSQPYEAERIGFVQP